MSKNITAISNIAEQTASGAQQTAENSITLAQLSDKQQQLLNRFKV